MDSLLDVPGVEIFFFGPADYSSTAGYPGQWEGPGVADAIPFPATAVREMGEEANRTGLYNVRLISQNPMNPSNTPKDNFENEAIRAI